MSEDLVYNLVRRCGAAIGHPELTPHDLRRYAEHWTMPNGYKEYDFGVELKHSSSQSNSA